MTRSMGPRGLIVLILAGLVGLSLAIVGWSQRHTGLVASGVGGLGGSAPAYSASASPARAGPTARAGTAPAATPSASGNAGPLLSSEPFAQFAYLVWPGPVSADGKLAMGRWKLTVTRQAGGITVQAAEDGQSMASVSRFYPGGAKVYILDSDFSADAAGNTNEGLEVTNTQGQVLP